MIQRNRILFPFATFELYFQIERNNDFRCRLKKIYDYNFSQLIWLVREQSDEAIEKNQQNHCEWNLWSCQCLFNLPDAMIYEQF